MTSLQQHSSMTNEDVCSALYRSLNIVECRAASSDNEDAVSDVSANSSTSGGALYRIIRRFENPDNDEFGEQPDHDDAESVPIQPGTVNSLRAQLTLFQDKPSRDSSVSVNSVLSRVSTLSNASFFSSHPEDEPGSNSPEKSVSPSLLRRSRFKPIPIGRPHYVNGTGRETDNSHWSYGVSQNELLNAINRRKKIIADDSNNADSENDEEIKEADEDNAESVKSEADGSDSNEQSTDTLIFDPSNDSDHYDNSTAISECSAERSNCDNYSNVSLSSFDIVPEPSKCDDSVTVSSDEYGSELYDARSNEFLSVSAVNEWCITETSESDPVILQVESKKEKYQRRLFERVNELLHTEVVYVDKLRHVVTDYIPEMFREDVPSGIRGLKFDIFANIEKIYEFHDEHLLPALRDCKHDLKMLGKCFRSFEKKFQLYVMYSRNNKRSNRLVYENRQFFKEKQTELGDRLDLSSYLLEPIQRLPRYRLFLEDLVKTCTHYDSELEAESAKSRFSDGSERISDDSMRVADEEASDADNNNDKKTDDGETTLESLQGAKTMIEALLRRVDDMIALENIKNCPVDLLEQGRLLRQEEFLVIDANRRRYMMRVFLFENLIMLTLIYRKQPTVELFVYKDSIPMTELGITPREKDVDRFSIFWRKRTLKPYTLVSSKPNVRNAWVKDIMRLLWKQAELNKEMLLKSRGARASTTSKKSESSPTSNEAGESEVKSSGEKYSSLRGVPGEARAAPSERRCASKLDKKRRRTTWYCE